MWSTTFSTRLGFPELQARWAAWFGRWLKRRGPVHPPLTLRYRQIYILPTGFGALLGILLVAMLMGSLNFNNNLGLFTTFTVAGIALLSMHLAHRNLDGLRIESVTAERVFAGQALGLHVGLADGSGRDRPGLMVEIPGKACSRVVDVSAWDAGEAELRLETRRRGWIESPRLKLFTRQPLGWFIAWSWFWPARRFLIWPQPAKNAPGLPLNAQAEPDARPGDESDEFHGLRAWREGDAVHRIAWKASQRHDQLLARQFSRPRRGRVVLRLEDAPGAGLEQRIAVVTAWILEAERRELDYGLILGQGEFSPDHGLAHRNRCLDALAEYR